MENNIVLLPISKLYAHPSNPRKNIGDISELTESIRTDGVLQNLTVIKGGPGVPAGQDGYTVIIGHRRKAAAEAAGLSVIPCSIVEMDEKKQISTMLVENMAREDLTIYEQAESFQMMIDLGETQESIAKMTGFSQGTVSRRLRLNKLNKEKFEKSQHMNIPLEDYLKLTQIEDEKERNILMDALGTKEFEWKVRNAYNRQELDKKKVIIKNKMNELGVEEAAGSEGISYNSKWEKIKRIKYDDISDSMVIDLKDYNINALKYEINWDGCSIYHKAKKSTKSEKKPDHEIQFNKDKARIREELMSKYSLAHSSRVDFMRNLPLNKGKDAILMAVAHQAMTGRAIFTSKTMLKDICNMTSGPYYLKEEEINKYIETTSDNWIALSALLLLGDDEELACISPSKSSDPVYCNDSYYGQSIKSLKQIYQLLESLGYETSEEERQLVDGTHPLFKEFEEIKAKYAEKSKKLAS